MVWLHIRYGLPAPSPLSLAIIFPLKSDTNSIAYLCPPVKRFAKVRRGKVFPFRIAAPVRRKGFAGGSPLRRRARAAERFCGGKPPKAPRPCGGRVLRKDFSFPSKSPRTPCALLFYCGRSFFTKPPSSCKNLHLWRGRNFRQALAMRLGVCYTGCIIARGKKL